MALDPNKERPSMWTVLPGGTHGRIVAALNTDPDIQKALPAATTGAAGRTALIDLVARRTGNCLGQVLVHQKQLAPADDKVSIYRALNKGAEANIATAIGQDTDQQLGLKAPPATNDAKKGPVFAISRMTGRCVFQEIEQEAGKVDLPAILKKLVPLL